MRSSEHFMNKEPSSGNKKNLIVYSLLGIILISSLIYYNYIVNNPQGFEDYPIIAIQTNLDELNPDTYINCTFELLSEKNSQQIERMGGTIKVRHKLNYDKYPKMGYRIELNRRVSLLGMRKDDDWLLMSMFDDVTRVKIKLGMDLWRSLQYSNPTAILPKSRYVLLYINGFFKGLFLLVERVDRNLFGFDEAQNNIDSSLIFQAKVNQVFNKYVPDKWEQDWPNERDDIYIMDEIMTNLIDFVVNSTVAEFFDPTDGIYSKFDENNLIDFYVFNFFILHRDFWFKDYYIVRNTNPNKFFLIPWDYDWSFGINKVWEMEEPDTNDEDKIKGYFYLYKRLIKNDTFMNNCSKRWFELRQNLFSKNKIMNRLDELYKENKEIIKLDIEMWPPVSEDGTDEFVFKDYIEFLYEWVPARLKFCDKYFKGYN